MFPKQQTQDKQILYPYQTHIAIIEIQSRNSCTLTIMSESPIRLSSLVNLLPLPNSI
ncbi:hypothetical protein LINPERPRIM_LOCUS27075, partial [Linum perenne]